MSRHVWFGPPPSRGEVPPPIEQRAAAMGIPVEAGMVVQGWCDACKRYRAPGELERGRRYGVDLVICKVPGPCITAARVAGLWEGRS